MYLFSDSVRVCVCMCPACICARALMYVYMPIHTWESEDNLSVVVLSFAHMGWKTELRLSGLAAMAFIGRAVFTLETIS